MLLIQVDFKCGMLHGPQFCFLVKSPQIYASFLSAGEKDDFICHYGRKNPQRVLLKKNLTTSRGKLLHRFGTQDLFSSLTTDK